MSMLSVLIKDLVEKTTLEDGTYLVAGTTDANKITFLNLVNAIKKKLGAAAQKSVANNLTTEASGTSVLDAYQGKLLSDKIDLLNSTLLSKNDLTNGGYQMHFYTINTNYSDRVEALKDSLQNRPYMFAVGVNIVYVISSNDDRGVGIIIKKNDSRCAFKYFDYWGENQFWILTSAGWEKKA